MPLLQKTKANTKKDEEDTRDTNEVLHDYVDPKHVVLYNNDDTFLCK